MHCAALSPQRAVQRLLRANSREAATVGRIGGRSWLGGQHYRAVSRMTQYAIMRERKQAGRGLALQRPGS
jgi:hypothetical protein